MSPEAVAKIVPLDGPAIAPIELDAIVTLAYLAMTADGGLSDDELAVFRAVVARVRARATPVVKPSAYRAAVVSAPPQELDDRETNAILDRLNAALERVDRRDHLYAQAEHLSREARHLAYKIVYAIALIDLDESPAEDELLEDVVRALQIDRDAAAQLVDEVLAALTE